MVFWHFYQKKSPSTLNRKGRIARPELYHTSQQLSHDCPINIFFHKHMYMEQTLRNLLSQRCHKHLTSQNLNRSVVLVYLDCMRTCKNITHISSRCECQTSILKWSISRWKSASRDTFFISLHVFLFYFILLHFLFNIVDEIINQLIIF